MNAAKTGGGLLSAYPNPQTRSVWGPENSTNFRGLFKKVLIQNPAKSLILRPEKFTIFRRPRKKSSIIYCGKLKSKLILKNLRFLGVRKCCQIFDLTHRKSIIFECFTFSKILF